MSISTSRKKFKEIKTVLNSAVQAQMNVLLRGESGVGKTHLIMDVCSNYGLKLKYFSASTLDPFADLVGIPVPEQNYVKYLRSADINEAEVMFFDELNRAHKRVMNAVFEIIQFKSLNGELLPNLKIVWAAVNPWDKEGYHTEELDIALQGRFHFNIDIPYDVSIDYFESAYGVDIATIAYDWWQDLSQDLKLNFSPRRLDYALKAMVNNLPYHYTSPFDVKVPLESLYKSISLSMSNLNINEIISNKQKYIDILEFSSPASKEYTDLVKFLTSLSKTDQISQIMDVIFHLPVDYLSKIIYRNNSYQEIRNGVYKKYGADKLIEWDMIIQEKLIA